MRIQAAPESDVTRRCPECRALDETGLQGVEYWCKECASAPDGPVPGWTGQPGPGTPTEVPTAHEVRNVRAEATVRRAPLEDGQGTVGRPDDHGLETDVQPETLLDFAVPPRTARGVYWAELEYRMLAYYARRTAPSSFPAARERQRQAWKALRYATLYGARLVRDPQGVVRVEDPT